MGDLKSWSCKGCTNICHIVIDGKIETYCRSVIEKGGNRKQWFGDYLACLDYTTDEKNAQ